MISLDRSKVVLLVVSLPLLPSMSFLALKANYANVKSYRYYPPGSLRCAANAPGCGLCDHGVVVYQKCYVRRGSVWDGS
jgi:surfactin synthase thioesterase subunit